MNVQFEPQEKYVTVTIEDDADATRFCELALEAVSCGDEDARRACKPYYDGYAKQMREDNTAHWDRQLWDSVVQRIRVGGVVVEITFSAKLMQLLKLI